MHSSVALLISLFAWPSLSVASPHSENRRILFSSSVPFNMEGNENEDQMLALPTDASSQRLILGAPSQSSIYLRPASLQSLENDQLNQLLNQALKDNNYNSLEKHSESQQFLNGMPEYMLPLLHQDQHHPLGKHLENHQALNGMPELMLPLLHQDYYNTLDKHLESNQILNGVPEHLLLSLSQDPQQNVSPVNLAANFTTPNPYHKSLEDFKVSVAEITKHFTENAFNDKDDKNFRYIVIIGAVQGLSLHIARHGWQTYNSSYHSLILQQIDEAVLDPQGVAERFICYIQQIQIRLNKIVALMNHPVIKQICSAMPSACDVSIYTVVSVLNDKILSSQAEGLLALGWAAESFQTHYASALEAISTQNAYKYLYEEGLTALPEQLINNVRVIMQLIPDFDHICYLKR